MCNKEGYREDKGLTAKKQKRRPETRCGCKARFQVHIVLRSHLWHVTNFKDFHNHELQIGMHSVLVASHRKMDECDIMQMNRLRKAGIDTLDIYNSFASKLGGYLNVQFVKKKNMYNQSSRQRRLARRLGRCNCDWIFACLDIEWPIDVCVSHKGCRG